MSDEQSDALNGDMTVRVRMRSAEMPWQESPSPGVWRKRLHRVGPAESGQVTSLVRYAAGSRFPPHDHPEGEEIFVLDGVFSDEHGDWAAGSYLLNPEGHRHAPFSREGCVIFVKLRQYAGAGRRQILLASGDLGWRASDRPGVEHEPLLDDPGFPDRAALERWAPGAAPGPCTHVGGAEILVIEGSIEDEAGSYGEGDWLRLPVGAAQDLHSTTGALLFVRRGLIPLLRTEGDPS